MELFVARQPVFDKSRAIIGYELLHRESDRKNEYTGSDGAYASSRVITGAFLSLGLDSLTSGKLAFINFTDNLLRSGVAMLLPKDQLVVEILETVSPTQDILNACEDLKVHGYTLALDDYVLGPAFEPLANMADIIKVDFRQNSCADLARAVSEHSHRGVRFLAEKVETEEEFKFAASLGYSLFQGYFFSRPVIFSANTLPVSKLSYMRLMQAVNCESPDFNLIISAIENDVTLSMETIKLSNSAFYGRRQKISSIRQAVVALGLDGVRKWIYLAALRRLGAGKPDALISTSILRAKFMELLSDAAGQPRKSAEYSMLGLFSLLDALTGCTFETLFARLSIAEEIKTIFIEHDYASRLGTAYTAMLAYERGEWEKAAGLSERIGLTMSILAEIYIESIKWFNDFMMVNAA
jgi:c-di-GMP-related signal transduction protein